MRGLEGARMSASVAEWIVRLHGGSISLASRGGDGTRLVVTLPADTG
jgi:signal transduction histidine kinase